MRRSRVHWAFRTDRGIPRIRTHRSRPPPDAGPSFFPALRREEQRRTAAQQGTERDAKAEHPEPPPIDRLLVGAAHRLGDLVILMHVGAGNSRHSGAVSPGVRPGGRRHVRHIHSLHGKKLARLPHADGPCGDFPLRHRRRSGQRTSRTTSTVESPIPRPSRSTATISVSDEPAVRGNA